MSWNFQDEYDDFKGCTVAYAAPELVSEMADMGDEEDLPVVSRKQSTLMSLPSY
jgi:hypothetical protein